MPDRLVAIWEATASLSSRYADYLRLIAAIAATYNALKGSVITRWIGRLVLKICAPCWPIYRWLRSV